MATNNERYTTTDLIKDYGKAKTDDYIRRVKIYAEEAGFTLNDPTAMARTWLRRDGHKVKGESEEKPAYEPETQSRRYISSMLFAMGRMEHDEMKKLPGVLWKEKAWIKGETVIIDWDIPGVTDEMIARIEHCLGMKLIIQGISVEDDLPF